jgi:hypothetical protein
MVDSVLKFIGGVGETVERAQNKVKSIVKNEVSEYKYMANSAFGSSSTK